MHPHTHTHTAPRRPLLPAAPLGPADIIANRMYVDFLRAPGLINPVPVCERLHIL